MSEETQVANEAVVDSATPKTEVSTPDVSELVAESKKYRKRSQSAEARVAELETKINSFEDIITNAYEHLAPNLVANYAFELSQIFNEFYHDCPVLGSIEEGFRLKLVDAFRITLKKSLDLLGIDVLEEM